MRITLSTGTPAEIHTPAGPVNGGLILWTDVFGLRPLFDAHAERLAADHGWVVVSPELYPGEEHLEVGDRLARAATLDDVDKMADLSAAIDATGRSTVNALGFCMGGMYAMKSLSDRRVERAVAFYGMVRVPESWRGDYQHDAIDTVRARAASGPLNLMCIFGGNDPWCPDEHQDEVERVGAEVWRYPGAGHGWAQDPDRDGYVPEAAADAWARAEAFLVGKPRA